MTTLTELLARRRGRGLGLAPAEVVTLMVAVASDLAELHARGAVHGAVGPGYVGFRADGRPVLLPPPAADPRVDPRADVLALASLGRSVLAHPPPSSLIAVLERAGEYDARGFAAAVLASGPAAPLQQPVRAPARHRKARPRWRAPLGLAVVAVIAVVAVAQQRPRASPDWSSLLDRLSGARSMAIAAAAEAGLAEVYVDGAARRRDAALVRWLAAHRLTVRGHLATLRLASVVRAGPTEALLAAREGPADYTLTDAHGHVVRRVRGPPRDVRVLLRRTPLGWRIAEVRVQRA